MKKLLQYLIDLKIKTKLLITFLFIVFSFLILSAGGLFGVFELTSINDRSIGTLNYAYELENIETNIRNLYENLRLNFNTLKNKKAIQNKIHGVNIELQKEQDNFKVLIAKLGIDDSTNTIKQYKKLIRELVRLEKKVNKAKLNNLKALFFKAEDTLIPIRNNLLDSIHVVENSLRTKSLSLQNEFHQLVWDIFYATLIPGFLVTVFSLGTAILITKQIIQFVKTTSYKFNLLANGELDTQMPVKTVKCCEVMNCGKEDCPEFDDGVGYCFFEVGSFAEVINKDAICPKIANKVYNSCEVCQVYKKMNHNEFASLSIWFNVFVNNFRRLLGQFQKYTGEMSNVSEDMKKTTITFAEGYQNQAASTEQISSTTEEVSAGIDSISSSVINQFSNLEALISKIKDLSGLIKEVENKTNIGKGITENVVALAKEGDVLLSKMDNSMENIARSSDEISYIVKIITDISEQVNLLSLNAAIEAARAGEAGRGFAVVADEISKLADKTSQSVSQIEKFIKENQSEIQEGKINTIAVVNIISNIIQGINSVNDSMDKIGIAIEKQVKVRNTVIKESEGIKELSEGIKFATEEQKIAISEIANAVTEISHKTQDGISGTEKMVENANNIRDISEELSQDIKYFSFYNSKEHSSNSGGS